jgi:hypothetical protein
MKTLCGAKTRNGGKPCAQPVVPGATRCRFHGGAAPQVRRAAERRLAEEAARQHVATELRMWSLDGYDPGTVDYTTTLLQLIGFWRYKFDLLNRLLGEAFNAAERLKSAHAAGKIAVVEAENEGFDEATGQMIPESPEYQTARSDLDRIFALGGVTALVGQKYDADRYGRVYPVEEGIRGLEKLAGEASEHLARNCVRAGQLKISAQRQEWAQQLGARLAGILAAVINAGNPSTEQRLAMQAEFERQMLPLAAGAVIEGALAG